MVAEDNVFPMEDDSIKEEVELQDFMVCSLVMFLDEEAGYGLGVDYCLITLANWLRGKDAKKAIDFELNRRNMHRLYTALRGKFSYTGKVYHGLNSNQGITELLSTSSSKEVAERFSEVRYKLLEFEVQDEFDLAELLSVLIDREGITSKDLDAFEEYISEEEVIISPTNYRTYGYSSGKLMLIAEGA